MSRDTSQVFPLPIWTGSEFLFSFVESSCDGCIEVFWQEAAGGRTAGPDNKRGQRGDSFPPWGPGGMLPQKNLKFRNSEMQFTALCSSRTVLFRVNSGHQWTQFLKKLMFLSLNNLFNTIFSYYFYVAIIRLTLTCSVTVFIDEVSWLIYLGGSFGYAYNCGQRRTLHEIEIKFHKDSCISISCFKVKFL